MNVERAILHLLDLHAKAEVRIAKSEERMDRLEKNMDRFDKSLVALRKVVATGMKLIVQIEKNQKKTDEKLDRLLGKLPATAE